MQPKPKRYYPKPPSDPAILFPYVSKVKVNKSKRNPVIAQMFEEQKLIPDDYIKTYIPDRHLKKLTKFYRPSFSPKFNSWIIDLVFYGKDTKIYLFILNVNTRFLVVYPLKSKSKEDIFNALQSFCSNYAESKPIHFKGDGEKGFAAIISMFEQYSPEYDVDFYLRNDSNGFRFTNSYNQIDSVVRTIRDLVGRVSQFNPNAFADERLLGKVIQIYNNTVHSAFDNKYTPAEVQDDFRLEAEYMRECEEKVKTVDQARLMEGMLTYEPGSILLVHLPLEKTPYKMHKRRRNFDELATFIRYEGGNCIVDLLHPYPTFSRVTVPTFDTKFLANSIDEYRQKYNDMFIINPS